MKLKYLLVCLALTACDDPGMTANAADTAAADDQMVVDHFRSLGADFEVRAIYDEQRGNVCYALMKDRNRSSPALSCVKESPATPDCTPPLTDAAGTRWPGTCPSDHTPGGH